MLLNLSFLIGGENNRSSRPSRHPRQLPATVRAQITDLRRQRRTGRSERSPALHGRPKSRSHHPRAMAQWKCRPCGFDRFYRGRHPQ
jgi:hypothetical protein